MSSGLLRGARLLYCVTLRTAGMPCRAVVLFKRQQLGNHECEEQAARLDSQGLGRTLKAEFIKTIASSYAVPFTYRHART